REPERAGGGDVEVGPRVDVANPRAMLSVRAVSAAPRAPAVVAARVGQPVRRRRAALHQRRPFLPEALVEVALDRRAVLARDVLHGLLRGDGEAARGPLEEPAARARAVLLVEEPPEVGALIVDREVVVEVDDVRV